MEIVVIPDQNKKEAMDCAKKVWIWLAEKKVSAALFCGNGTDFFKEPDVAVLLGGDGFIMKKSLELARLNIPFLAINFGRKGFLAVAEKENWQEVLEKVISARFAVQKRLILNIQHLTKKGVKRFESAGDVYLRHRSSMIRFNVIVNGEAAYEDLFGDGVVVATPTGATGYNLSAGGPLIEAGMVITPICPHAVNVKPIHAQDSASIEIIYFESTAHQDDEGCLFYTDGIKHPIEPGDRVLIRRSSKKASFVIPEGFSFFRALQKKLGLAR